MKKVAITLGCVCLILTIAIYIQINTVNSITNEEGISLNDNAELKGEVLRWRQASKDIYKELEDDLWDCFNRMMLEHKKLSIGSKLALLKYHSHHVGSLREDECHLCIQLFISCS